MPSPKTWGTVALPGRSETPDTSRAREVAALTASVHLWAAHSLARTTHPLSRLQGSCSSRVHVRVDPISIVILLFPISLTQAVGRLWSLERMECAEFARLLPRTGRPPPPSPILSRPPACDPSATSTIKSKVREVRTTGCSLAYLYENWGVIGTESEPRPSKR
jgi:hypothetical protein